MRSNGFSVVVINHGCKLNQFEGEAILQALAGSGFRVAKLVPGTSPDVVIVNTCTVTGKSDRKSRNSVLRAAEILNPNGLLIVTGCYAETDREQLLGMGGVSLVLGNREKPSIPDVVRKYFNREVHGALPGPSPFAFDDTGKPERSRVFIKVQDGCSMHCSYCKVPLARGEAVSRDYIDILKTAQRVASGGYGEVVLTGIDLGSYCYEGKKLEDLLLMILRHTPQSMRIRLSSIEPVHFSEALLAALSESRIAPHFHIPLQSGSCRILRLMGRPYGVSDYLKTVERLRTVKPDCHVASDIVVGFPTESEGDFGDTLGAIRNAELSSLHVFKYSVRKGTRAALLRDDVPYGEKVRRSRAAIALGSELNYEYRRRFVGSVLDAIFQKKNGHYVGVTGNYIRVQVASPERLEKKCYPVRITSADRFSTRGEIVLRSQE